MVGMADAATRVARSLDCILIIEAESSREEERGSGISSGIWRREEDGARMIVLADEEEVVGLMRC